MLHHFEPSGTSPPPLSDATAALRLARPVEVSPREGALPRRTDFLVFGKPVLDQAERDELLAVLESGWLGTGPRVSSFEAAFAQYKQCTADQAVALNSCTAALQLALHLAGIGPGDEVITTPLTFCATINVILHAGATPVLADVDPQTQNLDPAAVEAAITPRTAAILPVHFAGRPCDMTALVAIANRHGLELIEDCAHAIESVWEGRPTGTFGRFAAFSFYATKNVTTGEGGMLLCRNAADAQRARTLALHGLSRDAYQRFNQPAPDARFKHYEMVEPGWKCNMPDLAAALGLQQLRKVEVHWWRRFHVWQRYDTALHHLPLIRPLASLLQPDCAAIDESTSAVGNIGRRYRHALHLYNVLLPGETQRDRFLEAMLARNIGVGVHYRALTEHHWYQTHLGWKPDAFPHARRIGRCTASLPLTPGLSDADVDDVIQAVEESCYV